MGLPVLMTTGGRRWIFSDRDKAYWCAIYAAMGHLLAIQHCVTLKHTAPTSAPCSTP
jgi:hypothetical protein